MHMYLRCDYWQIISDLASDALTELTNTYGTGGPWVGRWGATTFGPASIVAMPKTMEVFAAILLQWLWLWL